MTLDEDGGDEVIGMSCIKDPEAESIMVVSEQGYGKRSDIEDYRKTNRCDRAGRGGESGGGCGDPCPGRH